MMISVEFNELVMFFTVIMPFEKGNILKKFVEIQIMD